MTEPQPWPTTAQRRRKSDVADRMPDVEASGVEASEVEDHDIPTPRHGRPTEVPVAGRVPSPFPRQRDDGETPYPENPYPEARHPVAQPYPQLPRPDPQVTRQPSRSTGPDAGQPRPTHVRDLVEPRTSQDRSAPAPVTTVVARDSGAMTALRVVTYVLVSLASLVFLAFVVYGGIRYVQLRDTLPTSPLSPLTSSSTNY